MRWVTFFCCGVGLGYSGGAVDVRRLCIGLSIQIDLKCRISEMVDPNLVQKFWISERSDPIRVFPPIFFGVFNLFFRVFDPKNPGIRSEILEKPNYRS